MAQLKFMLKASSLLETLIAMVVVLIVFTIAMGIYIQVCENSPAVHRDKLRLKMDELIRTSIMEENLRDEMSTEDSVNFYKSVSAYENYSDLLIYRVRAFRKEKKIGEMIRIVHLKNEDR